MSRNSRSVGLPDATPSMANVVLLIQSGPPVTRIDVLNPPSPYAE